MTIHDAELYMAGIWDWAILDGCFGETNIKPTDIDGLVERNGKFLILETKQPGAQIPTGQHIMFRNFIKRQGDAVLVIWGKKNEPEAAQLYSGQFPDGKYIKSITSESLRKFVATWFAKAEAE